MPFIRWKKTKHIRWSTYGKTYYFGRQGKTSTKLQMHVTLPTIATSLVPSWYLSFKNWITSNALALSWILEFAPLNWKILSFVSRINTSSWFSEERENGTWTSKIVSFPQYKAYYFRKEADNELRSSCPKGPYLLQSDNSFPFTNIQPCFKLFLLRFLKPWCNATLQWNNTWLEVR